MTMPADAALPVKTVAPGGVPTLREESAEASLRPSIARDAAEDLALELQRLRPDPAPESRWVALGWKLGLVIDLALLSLSVPAVIVIPPLLECRHTSLHVGFFAGDSFESCAERRIAARWKHFDARIKMLVRGSGQ